MIAPTLRNFRISSTQFVFSDDGHDDEDEDNTAA
jgi:hypothetical protein